MEHLDRDIVALMSRRVYDVAGCNPSVKVYLNGKRIPITNFGHVRAFVSTFPGVLVFQVTYRAAVRQDVHAGRAKVRVH